MHDALYKSSGGLSTSALTIDRMLNRIRPVPAEPRYSQLRLARAIGPDWAGSRAAGTLVATMAAPVDSRTPGIIGTRYPHEDLVKPLTPALDAAKAAIEPNASAIWSD